jgi:hypothetical protein
MKNLRLLFLVQIGFFAFLFSAEKEEISKIFQFKSGIVEYEVLYSDNPTIVKRTLYIDDYGKKLCMDYKIFSRGEKHFIYIFTEEGSIAINMNMKYAVKRKNPKELFDEEDLGEWFKEILYGERKNKIVNKNNFKGIDKVLEQECEVYEVGNERFWIWENLILKWEMSGRIQTAKKIQTNVSIPPEKFEVPKGIWVFPKIF